jgi:hypothetical protein
VRGSGVIVPNPDFDALSFFVELSPRLAELSIGEFIKFLAPRLRRSLWPPDVFAICASLLQRSGAYPAVVDSWPPGINRAKTKKDRRRIGQQWATNMRTYGLAWRVASVQRRQAPKQVLKYWRIVLRSRHLRVARIGDRKSLLNALLSLVSIADEACVGVGLGPGAVDSGNLGYDAFDVVSHDLLFRRSTLARDVGPNRVKVFPKQHTPQSGITIRSLTHHLALCTTTEVMPQWYRLPLKDEGSRIHAVIAPYPYVIKRSQFSAKRGRLDNMPSDFGFFSYEPRPTSRLGFAKQLVEVAQIETGVPVDLLIFPEASLTKAQHAALCEEISYRGRTALIAGVVGPSKNGRPGSNQVVLSVPIAGGITVLPPQHKHHRWRLDENQLDRYGLSKTLTGKKFWWEYVAIGNRELSFLTIHPAVVITTLICEDLARQDPVAELVRAVGPNLVIALLMDGPQIEQRWSARYATVLADDPGSSVLTVTSAGMVALNRLRGSQKSNSVALWRDAVSQKTVPIELKKNARGVSLLLRLTNQEEWTADGRSDEGSSTYPTLEKITQLRVRKSK